MIPFAVLVLLALVAGAVGALTAHRLVRHQPGGLAERGLQPAAWAVIVIGGVLVAALGLAQRQNDVVVRLDHHVAFWARDHASHTSTRLTTYVTDVGTSPVVPLLALLLVVVEWRRLPARTLAPFVIVTILGDQLLTVLLKDGFDRARPTLTAAAAGLGPSFPSGHSSTAAAFYAAAALVLARGRGIASRVSLAGAAVAIAVAVATSRVFLDVHWASDVVAGVALGWAWCALCAIAVRGRLFAVSA